MDAMHIVLGVMDDNKNFLGYFTLYLAIDCASRAVLGYHIELKKKLVGETPSGVMASLRNVLSVDMPLGTNYIYPIGGKPDEVILDHGRAYCNKAMRQSCQSLGISIQFTGTKMGWGKGIIEGFVKTLRKRFFSNIKGYRDGKKIKIRCSQRPENDNCVYLSELKCALDHYIHNEYHNTKLSGIELSTPKKEWERLYRVAPPVLVDEQDKCFFRTETNTRKMEQARGVTLKYQTFKTLDHSSFFSEIDTVSNKNASVKVEVYWDNTDASRITIVHPLTGELKTAYNVNNRIPEGMSFIEVNARRENNKLANEDCEPKSYLPILSEQKKKSKTQKRQHTSVPDDDIDLNAILDGKSPSLAVKRLEKQDEVWAEDDEYIIACDVEE